MKYILTMLFMLCSAILLAEPADSVKLPEVEARIVILDSDPSSWITAFGHVAIRMTCKDAGLDFAFSHTTDYSKSSWQMLSGEAAVSLLALPWNIYLEKYLSEGRRVEEYRLSLKDGEMRRLWALLDSYVAKGNYLSIDLLEHGCSEEAVSLILAAIDGEVIFDQAHVPAGSTPYELGRPDCDEHSLMGLVLSMILSSHAMTDEVAVGRKTMFPFSLYEMLSHATVHRNDGAGERPLLVEGSQKTYLPTKILTTETNYLVAIVLGIILVLTVVLTLMKFRFVDAFLLTEYSLITFSLLFFSVFCKLPSLSGWNWNMIAYNFIPLLVFVYSRWRNVSNAQWRWIHTFYIVGLLAYLGYALTNPSHFILEQYLLVLPFLFRVVWKRALQNN